MFIKMGNNYIRTSEIACIASYPKPNYLQAGVCQTLVTLRSGEKLLVDMDSTQVESIIRAITEDTE